MFKNVRYLYKMLGNTDISKLGDGTVTGAINALNAGLSSKFDKSTFAYTVTTVTCSVNGININVSSVFGKNVSCVLSVFGWGNYYRPSWSVINATESQYTISLHDPVNSQNYNGQAINIALFVTAY